MGEHKKHSSTRKLAVVVNDLTPPTVPEKTVLRRLSFVGVVIVVTAGVFGLVVNWYMTTHLHRVANEIVRPPYDSMKMQDNVDQLIFAGESGTAKKELDEALKGAKNNQERVEILLLSSRVAAANGNENEALRLAREANKIEESANAYGTIAAIAASRQEWKLAAEAYGKAVDLSIPTNNPNAVSSYNDYKNGQKEAQAHL